MSSANRRKWTTSLGALLLVSSYALLGLAEPQAPHRSASLPPELDEEFRLQEAALGQPAESHPRQLHLRRPNSVAGVPGEPVEMVVPPYENYNQLGGSAAAGSAAAAGGAAKELEVSYVFDHKRFIDSAPTRCLTSTAMDDPYSVEPSLVLITPSSETRLNATVPADHILRAGFDPRKKTTIIVHGFSQSYPNTVWLRRTRALFETNQLVGRRNLFIMDYGRASTLAYAQVAALGSGMGAFLANFVMKLYQLGQDPMELHLVGHSLGAHVAGFAGKRLRPKVGRITALDPAGPCFGKIVSNGENDRLNANDAHMVEVFHYDDDFLGLPGQVGQFDVYVNGGSSQPGCNNNMQSMFQALVTMVFRRKRVLSESHTRSTEVATARLTSVQCHEVAYECSSYESFLLGECGRCDEANNQCHFMALDYQDAELAPTPLKSSKVGRKFYISTGSSEPFCLQHYQILVKFQPSPELAQQAKRNKWRIQLEALDAQGARLPELTLTNQMAPNVFSYLYLGQSQPVKIRSARLQVRQADGKLVPLNQQPNEPKAVASGGAFQLPFQVSNVEINFMSHASPQARQSLSSRLCPATAGPRPPTSAANSIDMDTWLQLEECHAI